MPRLIWVFAGRTCHFVGFIMRRLSYIKRNSKYPSGWEAQQSLSCKTNYMEIKFGDIWNRSAFIVEKLLLIWATSWENLFMPYANNKGADQLAHPRSLISAFVVRCLDSIIPLVSISEISSLYLASVAEQACLSYLVANPENRFSRDEAHMLLLFTWLHAEPMCENSILMVNFVFCSGTDLYSM